MAVTLAGALLTGVSVMHGIQVGAAMRESTAASAGEKTANSAGGDVAFEFSEVLALAGVPSKAAEPGTNQKSDQSLTPKLTNVLSGKVKEIRSVLQTSSGGEPILEASESVPSGAPLAPTVRAGTEVPAGGSVASRPEVSLPSAQVALVPHEELPSQTEQALAAGGQVKLAGDSAHKGGEGELLHSRPSEEAAGKVSRAIGTDSQEKKAVRHTDEAAPAAIDAGQVAGAMAVALNAQGEIPGRTAQIDGSDLSASRDLQVRVQDRSLKGSSNSVTKQERSGSLRAGKEPVAAAGPVEGATGKVAVSRGVAFGVAATPDRPGSSRAEYEMPATSRSADPALQVPGVTAVNHLVAGVPAQPAPSALVHPGALTAQPREVIFHASLLGGAEPAHAAVAEPLMRSNQLEIGFHDVRLGWLSVRTSVAESGAVHASLSGSSRSIDGALGEMLPGLERYLRQHSIDVASVSLSNRESVAPQEHPASEARYDASGTAGSPMPGGTGHEGAPSKQSQAEQMAGEEQTGDGSPALAHTGQRGVREPQTTINGSTVDVRI